MCKVEYDGDPLTAGRLLLSVHYIIIRQYDRAQRRDIVFNNISVVEVKASVPNTGGEQGEVVRGRREVPTALWSVALIRH